MVALKAPAVDAFVARPDTARPVILVYGPDAGLVREHATALIRSAVDDMQDPFSLSRIDGDDLNAEPSRLVEEANTIPLFGGRRAVWVRAGAKTIAPAVEMLLGSTAEDCRVVIEAGDLKPNAPLRALCEKAKNAVTLPCYADNAQGLERLIDSELRAGGLTIAKDARTMVLSLLGGDRQASRSELQKLALYCHGRTQVERDDVVAIMGDASELHFDDVSDAAFLGRVADFETAFARARASGTSAGAILFAALRQVMTLHKMRAAMDGGGSAAPAYRGNYPRQKFFDQVLQAWSTQRLSRAMAQIAEAVLESRRRAALADEIANRVLLAIAMTARRRS